MFYIRLTLTSKKDDVVGLVKTYLSFKTLCGGSRAAAMERSWKRKYLGMCSICRDTSPPITAGGRGQGGQRVRVQPERPVVVPSSQVHVGDNDRLEHQIKHSLWLADLEHCKLMETKLSKSKMAAVHLYCSGCQARCSTMILWNQTNENQSWWEKWTP